MSIETKSSQSETTDVSIFGRSLRLSQSAQPRGIVASAVLDYSGDMYVCLSIPASMPEMSLWFPRSRRVFILGPSHHVPLSRCALSPAEVYRTPLYDLRIDQKSKSPTPRFTVLPKPVGLQYQLKVCTHLQIEKCIGIILYILD